jgi:hypothetical protein
MEDTSEERHFPALHFSEDVAQAVEEAEIEQNEADEARAWFDEQVRKGETEIHYAQKELTPALAEVLLEHNDGNRPVRPSKLAQYVSDVAGGRWEVNGETIIISKGGLLNNGQHRSLAVKEAGKPIPAMFVFGVERESRRTVDTGAARGAHDHLALEGYKSPISLASITRFVIAYERSDKQNFANTNRVTSSEIYERAKADPLLDEASKFPYRNARSKRLAPPSVMGFCYYVLSKDDPKIGEEFLTQMIDGVGLEADSPAYVVREKLMNLADLTRESKVEVIMRGYLAHKKGKTMKSIRILWELPTL